MIGSLCSAALMVLQMKAQGLQVDVPLHPPVDPKDGQAWNLRINRTVPMGFLLGLPDDYARDKRKRWPLLLFLHGSGERGTDLKKVNRHGPPKEIKNGRKLPFIVVSPQCPDNQEWDPALLTQLLDMVERRYRVDKSREYVTGLSLGGYGTYVMAAYNPGRFAAIAPISGGGSRLTVFTMQPTPTYVVHGDSDPVVPVEEDRSLAQYLRDAGCEVKYTEVKGGGHDVWSDVYAGNELYDWLLSHVSKRKP